MTLNITTFSMMAMIITDNEHNNALYNAECHYPERRVLFIVMLKKVKY